MKQFSLFDTPADMEPQSGNQSNDQNFEPEQAIAPLDDDFLIQEKTEGLPGQKQSTLTDLPELKSEVKNFNSGSREHAIAFHEARADHYLKLIARFLESDRCSAELKRSETARLHAMREVELEEIRRLGGG